MPMPRTRTPAKRCMICGCRFSRRRLQDVPSFQRQQFCFLSCANSRSKGGLSRKAFHARARKHRGPCCEACGTVKRLCVHHVDEDWTNNHISNLQTLCVFCHQYWHATHKRLGLKPSTRMPRIVSPSLMSRRTESASSEALAMRSCRRSPRSSSKPTSK